MWIMVPLKGDHQLLPTLIYFPLIPLTKWYIGKYNVKQSMVNMYKEITQMNTMKLSIPFILINS